MQSERQTESCLYGLPSREGSRAVRDLGRAPRTAATRGQWQSAAQAGDLFVASERKKKPTDCFGPLITAKVHKNKSVKAKKNH